MDERIFRGVDNHPVKKPIAYCHWHKGYLTKNLIKVHGCLRKHCSRLQRLDHEYWEQRDNRKENSKKRKQMLWEKVL